MKSTLYISKQQGVSLIITFLMMTVIVAIVFGISSILFHEVNIAGNAADYVVASSVAHLGIEQVWYFDKKKVPLGGTRGFCNICNVCNDVFLDPNIRCNNCTVSGTGCGLTTCTSCQVNYTVTFNGKTDTVLATLSPSVNPGLFDLFVDSKGVYKNATREITITTTK